MQDIVGREKLMEGKQRVIQGITGKREERKKIQKQEQMTVPYKVRTDLRVPILLNKPPFLLLAAVQGNFLQSEKQHFCFRRDAGFATRLLFFFIHSKFIQMYFLLTFGFHLVCRLYSC